MSYPWNGFRPLPRTSNLSLGDWWTVGQIFSVKRPMPQMPKLAGPRNLRVEPEPLRQLQSEMYFMKVLVPDALCAHQQVLAPSSILRTRDHSLRLRASWLAVSKMSGRAGLFCCVTNIGPLCLCGQLMAEAYKSGWFKPLQLKGCCIRLPL